MGDDIKYLVLESFPPDAQCSVNDLADEGFKNEHEAVVMRSRTDPKIIYVLLRDEVNGKSWLPITLS